MNYHHVTFKSVFGWSEEKKKKERKKNSKLF